MVNTEDKLSRDILRIKQIPIVPMMLEVICQATGMGFAAVARVTQERWVACSVRDTIHFGLEAGDELEVGTTICDEIRNHHSAVIIEHVDKDESYCNHPTPEIYGFQSYLSFPIILKNGDLFGTICAIDPKPALINNIKTIGMLTMFAELIAFHLQSIDLMEESGRTVQLLRHQLTNTMDESRQYQYISNHNLQEPLRKIRMFSDMLVNVSDEQDLTKTKQLAKKINTSAQRFSMMIKDLSDFSELNYNQDSFVPVDLNKVVADVCSQVKKELEATHATVDIQHLPTISAIPQQMEQLFFQLFNNAIKFSAMERKLEIELWSNQITKHQTGFELMGEPAYPEVEIRLSDNGVGIEKAQLEKIFDLFAQLPVDQIPQGGGIGLAYCRKIIRNHGGSIRAESEPGNGTIFSIVLPVKRALS